MNDKLPHTILFDVVPTDVEPQSAREKRERQMAQWVENVGALGWRRCCDLVGIGEAQAHRWMRMYPEFAAAHRDAMQETAARLECVADSIAMGETDATTTQVAMIQFRLKALRPDVYRERSSVQVDQRTTLAMDGGDASRARLLLAEWTQGGEAAP